MRTTTPVKKATPVFFCKRKKKDLTSKCCGIVGWDIFGLQIPTSEAMFFEIRLYEKYECIYLELIINHYQGFQAGIDPKLKISKKISEVTCFPNIIF